MRRSFIIYFYVDFNCLHQFLGLSSEFEIHNYHHGSLDQLKEFNLSTPTLPVIVL